MWTELQRTTRKVRRRTRAWRAAQTCPPLLVLLAALLLIAGGTGHAQPPVARPDPGAVDRLAGPRTLGPETDMSPETLSEIPTVLLAPTDLIAFDMPNDAGHGIILRWRPSPDDAALLGYDIFRLPEPDAPETLWIDAGTVPAGTDVFDYLAEDLTIGGQPNPLYVEPGRPVHLAVRGRTAAGSYTPWTPVVTVTPQGNWFHRGKVNVLVATLLFGFGTVYFIRQARKGRDLYIRPIPGINAVDEAIGRATEMGRPILFVLGTGTAGDIATIAGYTILARVAKKTAEYQTPILVPVNDPVMMAMAQETVKEAYLQAGRPDVYRPESIYFISAMQFPYVAAVNGLMLRERTATNFYMGVFHAESLLLAEAGSVTGSIQISGTDQVSQIPFFVAATDYTLIGEELYAASAYLSQEPALLGPLKAQDLAKVIILIFVIVAVLVWAITGTDWLNRLVHPV